MENKFGVSVLSLNEGVVNMTTFEKISLIINILVLVFTILGYLK